MITIHPRSYYIGTSAERAALTLPADAMGAHFFDTDLASEFFWDGTAWVEHAGGGGASTFLDLLDTPGSYAGAGLYLARVNAGEDALEFSTDLPDHDHSAVDGQGGVLDHGGLDGLVGHDHPLYIPITGVSRLRAGVVTVYTDPDDAFTAADTAGDVVLVPPGTWTLTIGHTLPAGVSLFGLGPAEACILSANLSGYDSVVTLSTGAGVVQNVKIVATLTRSDNGVLAGLTLNSGTTARSVYVHITATSSAATVYGVGIYMITGAWAINCRAYAYVSGTLKAYAFFHYGGYILYCYGYAEKTADAAALVCGLFLGSSTTTYSFQSFFEAGGSIGLRYGIYVTALATNYAYQCFAVGATADLQVDYLATLVLNGCKYNTVINLGTISQMGGDRAGTARADTISGLWTFDRGAATAPLAIAQADAPTVTNLDADKLDTYEASAFPRKAENAAIAGAWTFNDDVYLAAAQDVLPDGETLGAGVFKRLTNHLGMATYDDHFRSGAIPSGYTWDTGALFVGTPPSLVYSYGGSWLGVALSAAGKAFLRKPVTNAAASWQLKSLRGRLRAGIRGRLGFRFDNGSDVANDERFVELYVDASAGDATGTLNFRYKNAAGAPSTLTSAILVPATQYLAIYLYCYYTGGVYSGIGYIFGEEGSAVNVAGFSINITWVPCAGRAGIMLETTGASNYNFCDWFINNFT